MWGRGSRRAFGRLWGMSMSLNAKEVLKSWDPQSIVKGLFLRQESRFCCLLSCFGLKSASMCCTLALKYSHHALVLASQCVATHAMAWCGFTCSFLGKKRGIPQCYPSLTSKSGGDACSPSFPMCVHMLQGWEQLTGRMWQFISLNLLFPW